MLPYHSTVVPTSADVSVGSHCPCSSRSTRGCSSEARRARVPTVYTLQSLCYEPKRGSEIFGI